MLYPIVDFHCDLLAYLAESKSATPFQEEVRCSIPQLEEGGVAIQVCALFSETKKGSTSFAEAQLDAFSTLSSDSTSFLLSIENLSCFLEEDEPITLLTKRLSKLDQPVYASLTWNTENRFGGGNQTHIGLKEDGKCALECLAKYRIALDLSHTSDQLARDSIAYIDASSLPLPIMASHSNARKCCDTPRNLPDDLIQEIISRNGVIGLNGIRHFTGKESRDILHHIEHILTLGGENAIVLGADFFGGLNLPSLSHLYPYFFDEFQNARMYPQRIQRIEKAFGKELTEKIAYKNAQHFLTSLTLKEKVSLS